MRGDGGEGAGDGGWVFAEGGGEPGQGAGPAGRAGLAFEPGHGSWAYPGPMSELVL